jgi:cobalt-zinc-cadmium efflux system protein
LVALVANLILLVVEIVGGVITGSLALLADAAHMVSDVAALGVALLAQRLIERPASVRHTYGLQRAEVLGAQANAMLLIVGGGVVLFEAFRRLGSPPAVEGGGLLVVATLGFIVNVASAIMLARVAGRSMNMRGALWHMTSDAAGSLAAIVAGVAIVVWQAGWVDPAASIVIAVLVLVAAWRLLRDTVGVLLESAPRDLDARDVERTLAADPAVEDVHHLHLWSLASDVPAVSAHVVLHGEVSLHEAQVHGDRLRAALMERFGIGHATLELECHGCGDEHRHAG